MSYSNPKLEGHYQWNHDFGAGSGVQRVQGPKGSRGFLKAISVEVTETFTNDTTPAYVRVGTNADNDAHAEMDMGVAAIDTVYNDSNDDTDAIINGELPADTLLEVNFVAPTGGTPAGIGNVSVWIDWF